MIFNTLSSALEAGNSISITPGSTDNSLVISFTGEDTVSDLTISNTDNGISFDWQMNGASENFTIPFADSSPDNTGLWSSSLYNIFQNSVNQIQVNETDISTIMGYAWPAFTDQTITAETASALFQSSTNQAPRQGATLINTAVSPNDHWEYGFYQGSLVWRNIESGSAPNWTSVNFGVILGALATQAAVSGETGAAGMYLVPGASGMGYIPYLETLRQTVANLPSSLSGDVTGAFNNTSINMATVASKLFDFAGIYTAATLYFTGNIDNLTQGCYLQVQNNGGRGTFPSGTATNDWFWLLNITYTNGNTWQQQTIWTQETQPRGWIRQRNNTTWGNWQPIVYGRGTAAQLLDGTGTPQNILPWLKNNGFNINGSNWLTQYLLAFSSDFTTGSYNAVDGYVASGGVPQNTSNNIVKRTAAGYVGASYFNSSAPIEQYMPSSIFYEYNNDGFHRKMSPETMLNYLTNPNNFTSSVLFNSWAIGQPAGRGLTIKRIRVGTKKYLINVYGIASKNFNSNTTEVDEGIMAFSAYGFTLDGDFAAPITVMAATSSSSIMGSSNMYLENGYVYGGNGANGFSIKFYMFTSNCGGAAYYWRHAILNFSFYVNAT